jgi:hypothetical protein
VARGCWEDGSLFLKAIEDYRAAYATVHWYPREFYQKNKKLVDDINMRLGYRLQLIEASWPSEMSRDQPLTVGYRWRNAGAAPCYPGGHPALTLKDAKGGIVGVFVDESFDMRALPVGPPGKALPIGRQEQGVSQADRPLISYSIPPAPIFKAGAYDVFISVGDKTGTPKIALPLAGSDGQRRYRLGKIVVR